MPPPPPTTCGGRHPRFRQPERESAAQTRKEPTVGSRGRSGTEDCLFLNVYRPHRPHEGGPLPEEVWLHGGGFMGGVGNDFDPIELVTENDIMVVAVNFRLGALGFLAAPALNPDAPSGICSMGL
ncbi:carboxylesterase family protein [Streptomyces sp. NPDC059272]|uniref:carboxylesterase family protein n=1 Tax=Streptomyces sp. NPDC059272 TaxID=3346800 RepID=UPI00369614B9